MKNHQLACEIAEALFTNGQGDRARILLLQSETGRQMGGWIETAAVEQIEKVLNAMEPTA